MPDRLIERLEAEHFGDIADELRDGATIEEVLGHLKSTGYAADQDGIRVIENWQRNRRGAERVRRQRKRLQRQVDDLTGERDRARRDRGTLKRWIEANVPDAQVEGKSGRYVVCYREDES
jgi:hypothetical protein